MVMGKVTPQFTRGTHYAEIILNKDKFDIKCSCGWKKTTETRVSANLEARIHITELVLRNA